MISPLDVVVFHFMYTTTNQLIARPNKNIIDTPITILWTMLSDEVSTYYCKLEDVPLGISFVLFCFITI